MLNLKSPSSALALFKAGHLINFCAFVMPHMKQGTNRNEAVPCSLEAGMSTSSAAIYGMAVGVDILRHGIWNEAPDL